MNVFSKNYICRCVFAIMYTEQNLNGYVHSDGAQKILYFATAPNII